MSRKQLIHALCDIYGFKALSFNNQTAQDIWWYISPQEKRAVKEYIKVEKELQLI